MRSQEVIRFWFKECTPAQWFKKSAKFDAKLRKRFLKVHQEIMKGEHADWRKTPKGRLAEIIVLDQFSRNMFRGKPAAFASDPLGLALAQEAIAAGAVKKLKPMERHFLYMPFMHSESKKVQKLSLKLFSSLGDKRNLQYAKSHKIIVDRFGRYPHRNRILGRTSTAAEKRFMLKHKGY